MDSFWKAILWRQFGAAIDMLGNAMRACPQEVWSGELGERPEWLENDVVGFWYVAFHTLFFLDYYLSGSPEAFAPPPPFTLDELDPRGLLPEQPYAQAELLSYLDHCRNKCRSLMAGMTEQQFRERCGFPRFEFSNAEMLLYNLRHVQHHAGQLNLLLRQGTGSAPQWVGRAEDLPGGE